LVKIHRHRQKIADGAKLSKSFQDILEKRVGRPGILDAAQCLVEPFDMRPNAFVDDNPNMFFGED